MRLPKKIGDCIDLAYAARAERLALQKEMEEKLEKLKAREAEIEKHIIDTFDVNAINGAKGNLASASVSLSAYPTVPEGNWPGVWKWIAKHDAWDLARRQLNEKAFRERLEAGQKIPGVETFQKKKLSLTKI